MKPLTEQIKVLFNRAVTLKADSYLNKANLASVTKTHKQKLARALAASVENTKWNEVVSEAAELFKECSYNEQQEVLTAIADLIDIQRKVAEHHPASFKVGATRETADLFMQQTKGYIRHNFGLR